MSNSTFYFNIASYDGGGIYNSGASGAAALAVVASTFSGNGVYTNVGATGLFNNGAGATLEIADTILAGSPFQPNIYNQGGPVISLGYNLCSDFGNNLFTNATDRINTNPKLGPFTYNGGPTWTCAPMWGSPAIDQGKSFGLITDQRGQARPFDFPSLTNASGGDGSDIGAVEFILPPPSLSIAALTNTIQLQGAGLSNLTYTIQAATNLNPVITWTNLGTSLANSNGIFSLTDTNAPSFPGRFYRAVWP